MNKTSACLIPLLACTLALGACTVVPPRVTISGPSVAVVAPVAPPPPRVEVIPEAPGRDFFWVPGYWHWESNQHRWMDGHWEHHREREHWVPHRWDRDDQDHYRLSGGYWHRD